MRYHSFGELLRQMGISEGGIAGVGAIANFA